MLTMLISNLPVVEWYAFGSVISEQKLDAKKLSNTYYDIIILSSNIENYQSNEIDNDSIAAEPNIPYGVLEDLTP